MSEEYPSVGDAQQRPAPLQIAPRDLWIVVFCPTGVTFNPPGTVTFDLPQERVKVRFQHLSSREAICVRQDHDLPGLLAIVEMPQRSGDLLIHALEAKTICDGIIASAFAMTLSDTREPYPVFACDATQGLKWRPFIHFFSNQSVIGRRANLDPRHWSELTPSIFQSSSRVLRAVRWLRKMHNEDDILDRFVAGWTGLETLNPELCTHFSISPSGEDVYNCKKCGEKFVRSVPRATGLKHLFTSNGMDLVYKTCSNARNGLVHGFQEISSITSVARQYTSDIAIMLARGINMLSKIPIDLNPDKFSWLNGSRVASILILEGTMDCGELGAYEKKHGGLPLFEAKLQHVGSLKDQTTHHKSSAYIHPVPECVILVTGMSVSGTATIINFRVEPMDVKPS